jgi:alpha-L-fucosidase 2
MKLRKFSVQFFILIFSSLICTLCFSNEKTNDPLDVYNVIWDSPSQDHNGSMPIGNGNIGVNTWVEPNGDLLLLMSKTDAWSENCRLLKLGRVRIKLFPNPFANNEKFKQELLLRQGEIIISAVNSTNTVELRIWVDANRPAIFVETRSNTPIDIQVNLETWRNQKRQLAKKEEASAYGIHQGPSPIFVYPDTVLERENHLLWYHRNKTSIWKNNLEHQGLAGFLSQSSDPLTKLTFGAGIQGDGLVNKNNKQLVSKKPRKEFIISIHPLCEQTETVQFWLTQLEQNMIQNSARQLEVHKKNHQKWWDEFWNKSWIRITGSPEVESVTQAYTLQRWISACAGRGAYPIKFNGSIFNVDGDGFDADYRRWGGPYWWQNTRLPYWPMLASGDFDMMRPLFKMYQDMLPLAEYRTRQWHGHDGAFIGETVYFWGMYSNTNYGWERDPDAPVGVLNNLYIRYEFTASLELLSMMLDYFSYTGDAQFLQHNLLPMSDTLLKFWDQHYQLDKEGKMKMYPAQALETLQDAENPTPDIAGLHWVVSTLLALDESQTGHERRDFWQKLLAKTPPVPMTTIDGKTSIIGAAKNFDGRKNVENPELYAVFPFRLYGIDKPNLDIGRATFDRRVEKGSSGWQQDDTQAAFLGLTKIAADFVVNRATTKHEQSRFPAFWGPNYDWVPDQDHGGNLLMALQTMLLQADDGKIHLLPAWPESWDVDFKLHAPQNTTVRGQVKNGTLIDLHVSPESRRQDIIMHNK